MDIEHNIDPITKGLETKVRKIQKKFRDPYILNHTLKQLQTIDEIILNNQNWFKDPKILGHIQRYIRVIHKELNNLLKDGTQENTRIQKGKVVDMFPFVLDRIESEIEKLKIKIYDLIKEYKDFGTDENLKETSQQIVELDNLIQEMIERKNSMIQKRKSSSQSTKE